MSRRLLIIVLTLVLGASAGVGNAFAKDEPKVEPGQIVSQGSNFRPMPCLAATSAFSGIITVTQATGKNDGKKRTFAASLEAAVLVTYRPQDASGMPDPSLPSFLGMQVISQSFSLPAGTPSAEFPVRVPVIGSDGSTSAIVATATATFTPVGKDRVSVEATIGNFTCATGLVPAATPLDPAVSQALQTIVDDLSLEGASGRVTQALVGGNYKAFKLYSDAISNPTTVSQILRSPSILHVLNALHRVFAYYNTVPQAA